MCLSYMFLLVPLLAVIAVLIYIIFFKPVPLPEMDMNAVWGPKGTNDTSIRPFKIKFEDAMIQDLKMRLKNHRKWTPELEGVSCQYGFNVNWILDDWIITWTEFYDFQAREKFLNQYPQFKTSVQGLDVHFIRVVPEEVPSGVEVVPLLLLHGWPGSVREFYEAIPFLTSVSNDRDFTFEVIVPSLPGFGFSDPATVPGLGPAEMAVVFKNLMNRLGHKQFYLQGGCLGSIIGTNMATLFADDILGFYNNMPIIKTPLATFLEIISTVFPSPFIEDYLRDRIYPLTQRWAWLMEETGFLHLQATKPDTIGIALSDSPVGLLAYFLEKFSTWTRPDHAQQPDGLYRFYKEMLLDNLMIYWASGSVTTSMRLFAETFSKRQRGLRLDSIPTSVPTRTLQVEFELMYQPPHILRTKFKNLVHTRVFRDGGHFIALEMPKAFAEDVIEAVTEFRMLKKNKTGLEFE